MAGRLRTELVLVLSLLTVVGAINAVALWPQREIDIETIIGAEFPGHYKHAPSACELSDGDILLAYCGGSGEYATDPAIWAMRWDHRTRKWDPPRIIADEPQKADANPVLWRDPDNHVWLFYVTRHGTTWSTAVLRARQSADEGRTWRDLPLPFDAQPMMTRCKPIVLADKTYLLPVYREAGMDTEFLLPETSSFFLKYDPQQRTWQTSSAIHSRLGNLQPAVVELEQGLLVAYCRRGGGYGGQPDGFVVRSESRDGGLHWSEGKDTAFPNPNSAVDFVKLKSGVLLLAYNDSMRERSPLAVALSNDHDRSYLYKRDIVSGGLKDYAYPCVLQTADDKIHLFFSADGRTCIKQAVFEERDLLR